MASLRKLPCEACGKEVALSRDRFLQLVQDREFPLCGQCRRFVRGSSTRLSTLASERDCPRLGLAQKVRRGAKRRKAIASQPLARCGD